VDTIEIDVIGLQPLEARFHCLHHHALAVVASRVRIGARSSKGVFRAHHEALAVALDKLAEERFARPVRVEVSSVDETV
jgi:hypothetical protein